MPAEESFASSHNFKFPNATHGEGLIPYKTVNDALKSLDLNGINDPKHDVDNRPMNHTKKSIRRFKLIPEGKNIVDVLDGNSVYSESPINFKNAVKTHNLMLSSFESNETDKVVYF